MLKPPIDRPRISGFRRGVSLIEILVVTGFLATFIATVIVATRQSVKPAAGYQAEAVYYTQLSFFLEMLDRDCRMASRLVSTADGCELEIPSREGSRKIVYRRLEHGIERRQGGQAQVFDFGRLPNRKARLLFRIEEVSP